jgi:hypothetical protein
MTMNHDLNCAKFGINYISLPLKLTILGFFMWKKYFRFIVRLQGKIRDVKLREFLERFGTTLKERLCLD